nr:MAG TPA_asm: hypothetical protein [Caudoviricetes sp.]
MLCLFPFVNYIIAHYLYLSIFKLHLFIFYLLVYLIVFIRTTYRTHVC